jgi:hypothetical protein
MTDTKPFTATADGGREIPLEKPIIGHQGQITHIRLREPTFKDFVELGDPTTLVVTQHAVFPQDDMAIIRSYIERLASVDTGVLGTATFRDAMAMRDALKDFFLSTPSTTSTRSVIS